MSQSHSVGFEKRDRYCVYGDSWDWLFEKRKKEWKGRRYKQLHGKGVGWSFPLEYAQSIESELVAMLHPPSSAPISVVVSSSDSSSATSEEDDEDHHHDYQPPSPTAHPPLSLDEENESANHTNETKLHWIKDDEDENSKETIETESTVTTSSSSPTQCSNVASTSSTNKSSKRNRTYRVNVSNDVVCYFRKYI